MEKKGKRDVYSSSLSVLQLWKTSESFFLKRNDDDDDDDKPRWDVQLLWQVSTILDARWWGTARLAVPSRQNRFSRARLSNVVFFVARRRISNDADGGFFS